MVVPAQARRVRWGVLLGTALVAAASLLVLRAAGVRRSGPPAPDVTAARADLPAAQRDVLDLVVALRGLESGGKPDLGRAESLCHALRWPRCDPATLDEIKRRSASPNLRLATADAIWAFADEAALRAMFRTELDRLPESDGPSRARVFLRFGIIDTNPDGQAALFSQACTADPGICDYDRLRQAADRQVQARFVAPGNHLPLYFGGHPRIPGPQ